MTLPLMIVAQKDNVFDLWDSSFIETNAANIMLS